MDTTLKVLFVDTATGYYRIRRYPVDPFFGPVDLGLHLSGRYFSMNIGTGLLAGSIFPGSNRLIFTGFSPCWRGFYVSSMGGAGLVFGNLGVDMVSLVGKAPLPSLLYLNRTHGEEIEVEIHPVGVERLWKSGRGGVYSLLDHALETFGDRYLNDPRVLAAGPAALATDFGGICSVPVVKGKPTHADTWAGRGGLGSKMLQDHGIAGIIYGGTFVEEDFRDRKVADQWFQDRYDKKLKAKDLEATTKYRFDPRFGTGGTFGVNFATLGGRLLSFNYGSLFLDEAERVEIHKKFVLDHYLKQFNEETIAPKHQKTCGEPCAAVCKKMRGEFKKDYEPYQTMGPLSGVFDQRAAEMLVHKADTLGFDAISAGGVLSWLMECLSKGLLQPEDLGVRGLPVFEPKGFRVVEDSQANAELGVEILDAMVEGRGILDFREGARKLARRIAREKGKEVLDCFVYNAFGRKGWIVPNQYWTPGALAPMAIMGKYYMHYGPEYLPPRELGRKCAERLEKELVLDNLGTCRFHRAWAEDMLPDVFGQIYGKKEAFLANLKMTASRINSRNASVYWEPRRNLDFLRSFLERKVEVEGEKDVSLQDWLDRFRSHPEEAGLDWWYEVHKGIHESLREF